MKKLKINNSVVIGILICSLMYLGAFLEGKYNGSNLDLLQGLKYHYIIVWGSILIVRFANRLSEERKKNDNVYKGKY